MYANKHLLNVKPSDPITAMKIIRTSIAKCFHVLTVADLSVLAEVWLFIKCINMLKLLVNQYCNVIFALQLLLVKTRLKRICDINIVSPIKPLIVLSSIINFFFFLDLLFNAGFSIIRPILYNKW